MPATRVLGHRIKRGFAGLATTYVLKSGDDPVTVAAAFGIEIEALADANADLMWGVVPAVEPFTNAVKGSRIEGTSSPQIDVFGTDNVAATFSPTRGVVKATGLPFPVYASSVKVKGAGNNFVYFPGGKWSQPFAAGGSNPASGRVFFAAGEWRAVAEWAPGQTINIPGDDGDGDGGGGGGGIPPVVVKPPVLITPVVDKKKGDPDDAEEVTSPWWWVGLAAAGVVGIGVVAVAAKKKRKKRKNGSR